MKLSIITVNKDNDLGLERTCQSVICQDFDDFEWLIIDGASSDKSVEIIKIYAYKMAYWRSEPDTGIYNAMNNGIRQSKGDFCLFLNSGDWFYSCDSLSKAFDIIKNSEEADIYYGDCIYNNNKIWKMPEDGLSIDDFYLQKVLSHQNTFIKRSLFYNHEFYNENYRTISDSIFFLREYFIYHSKFIYINTIISVYIFGDGVSATDKNARKELEEEIRNIIGNTDFNLLVRRYKEKINIYIKTKRIIFKILKYLLPYGIYKIYLLFKNKNMEKS